MSLFARFFQRKGQAAASSGNSQKVDSPAEDHASVDSEEEQEYVYLSPCVFICLSFLILLSACFRP
jgi:hypothetical protein